MAKKITKPVNKKPVKAAGPSKIKVAVNFLKSNQFKYTLGAFLLLFSGYLAVAFTSYGFSGAVDQSKLDLPILDFLDRSVQVQNFAGKGGAYLAEQFINLGFGFPSFFFILIFVVAALNLFGYKEIRFLKTFLFSVLWMLWTSIALALLLNVTSSDSFFVCWRNVWLYFFQRVNFIFRNDWSYFNLGIPAVCIANRNV